ncbi:fimbria/pilus outer membrane usher protein, partial [Klebsiella quasipneumoniae subsp. quasipneumoniae]
YSNNYKRLGYYIYAQKSQDANHKNNQIVGISFSIPIGGNDNIHTRFNYDKNNGNQLQATYTGSRGDKNELSYGLTTSYDMPKEGGHESSIGANGSYRTHYAYLNASASAGKNQQQYSLGTSGALVAHEGGVIATPDIGETFAIVQAPKAAGATVANRIGRPVDNRGYTIIPYLNPFTENWLDLDPQGISDQVEIVSSSTVVVP